MTRNFETWLSSMQTTITSYKYYTDFNKVVKKTTAIKRELSLLNTLIGSENIESEFRDLISEYPEVWNCVPILIAKRDKKLYAGGNVYGFGKRFNTVSDVDGCVVFMRETGLFDFISKRVCNNLVDYVFGVETGLDSHSRKNRSGDAMEEIVEYYLKESGLEKDKDFKTQQVIPEYDKKFDFVVYGKKTTYVIETNYYSDGGSKPREICRAYLPIYERQVPGFKFIWITDGQGWKKEHKLIEACFNEMGESLWNIKDLKNGFVSKLK